MNSPWIYWLLLGSLCSGVIPAPLDTPYEEQDPELTGGYFEGDIDVVLGMDFYRQQVDGQGPQYPTGYLKSLCSPDRGEYVKILEENIIEGKEKNFFKYDASELGPFDPPYYASILHYGPKVFSANGKPTIKALSPEGQSLLGQRLIMTEVDINRLNIMYKCPSPL